MRNAVEFGTNMANLVKVKFVGRCTSEVDPDGLGEITVVVGETISALPEIAAALLQQPANWQPVSDAPAAPVVNVAKSASAKELVTA